MIVNGKEFDVEKLAEEQSHSFLKRQKNGLLLSDEDISVLNNYDIDYSSVNDIKELLFLIDEVLEDNGDLLDLEELSDKLGECNYYNYTNK